MSVHHILPVGSINCWLYWLHFTVQDSLIGFRIWIGRHWRWSAFPCLTGFAVVCGSVLCFLLAEFLVTRCSFFHSSFNSTICMKLQAWAPWILASLMTSDCYSHHHYQGQAPSFPSLTPAWCSARGQSPLLCPGSSSRRSDNHFYTVTFAYLSLCSTLV